MRHRTRTLFVGAATAALVTACAGDRSPDELTGAADQDETAPPGTGAVTLPDLPFAIELELTSEQRLGSIELPLAEAPEGCRYARARVVGPSVLTVLALPQDCEPGEQTRPGNGDHGAYRSIYGPWVSHLEIVTRS